MSESGGEHAGLDFQHKKKLSLPKVVTAVKDRLFPNAERIDIQIENPESIERSIELLKLHGVDTEPEILRAILNGYNEGLTWVLNKFNYKNRPDIIVVSSKGNLIRAVQNGYDQQHDVIFIDKESFKKFTDKPIDKPFRIIQDEVAEMRLTIPQFAGVFAVEETTHYLAAHNIKGLSAVPKQPMEPRKSGQIEYYRQPHERDALIQSGIFLQEKYGENPLAPLEEAILSPLQK